MSKSGKRMVCVLDELEVIEWIAKVNDFMRELSKKYIAEHEDLAKVSDIIPFEESVITEEADGSARMFINAVEIDYFVEE
jgi:hypothetical protein